MKSTIELGGPELRAGLLGGISAPSPMRRTSENYTARVFHAGRHLARRGVETNGVRALRRQAVYGTLRPPRIIYNLQFISQLRRGCNERPPKKPAALPGHLVISAALSRGGWGWVGVWRGLRLYRRETHFASSSSGCVAFLIAWFGGASSEPDRAICVLASVCFGRTGYSRAFDTPWCRIYATLNFRVWRSTVITNFAMRRDFETGQAAHLVKK